MSDLKTQLYAKFGSSINLEADEEWYHNCYFSTVKHHQALRSDFSRLTTNEKYKNLNQISMTTSKLMRLNERPPTDALIPTCFSFSSLTTMVF